MPRVLFDSLQLFRSSPFFSPLMYNSVEISISDTDSGSKKGMAVLASAE